MKYPFMTTTNGTFSMALSDPIGSPGEQFVRELRQMDGLKRHSFSLWRLPPGKDLDQIDSRDWTVEYLQSAGSADNMVVEVRVLEDGKYRHYVAGHRSDAASDPMAVASWD